jgi:anti-sigma B factor antagonist
VTDLQQSAEPVIVRLPAEIDLINAEDVGEQLRSAFTRGAAVVIADLTSTVLCDSSGTRQLVVSHNHADFHDAQMRFVIPDLNVLRIVTLTGLDQLLSIYPSLDAAVSAGSVLDGDAASGWSRPAASGAALNLRPLPGQGCFSDQRHLRQPRPAARAVCP